MTLIDQTLIDQNEIQVQRQMRMGFIVLVFLIAAVVSLSSCAPKDEKLTGGDRPRSQGNQLEDHPAPFHDRSAEYSRSMLIEIAQIADQLETVLHKVELAPSATPTTPATVPTGALVQPACKKLSDVTSPAGVVRFNVDIKDCKETGLTFDGLQKGRESYLAMLSADPAKRYPTIVRIEGRGIETNLRPISNKKDSLFIREYKFLSAEIVSEDAAKLVYRFGYVAEGSYDLDLKNSTDSGLKRVGIEGLLIYDIANKSIVSFTTEKDFGGFDLGIQTDRKSRSGSASLRQQMRITASPAQLGLNLKGCSLPEGDFESRFTVRLLGKQAEKLPDGSDKFLRDVKTAMKSTGGEIQKVTVDGKPVDLSQSKLKSPLCTGAEQISFTDSNAGLIY